MKVVDLSCVDAFGVVVKAPTGVKYSTQTGGMSCHHPEVEGYYIPINAGRQMEVEGALHKLLCGDLDGNADIASQINPLLELAWVSMRVDTDHLNDTEEAWIHAVLDECGDEFSPFFGLEGAKVVLLYGNCD